WLVATGMRPAGAALTYTERNYHDLVDKPFFVGRFDLDSAVVSGRRTRLATYPAGLMGGLVRKRIWEQIGKTLPVMASVFQETPWSDYTVMMVFTSQIGGGSALEHQNSHLGIYNPGFLGNPVLASITAHEIFHAWNVKRLRPADMVPYRYDSPEPTPWLWVSEGITDYYSDLAMVRGGINDSAKFLSTTADKIGEIAAAPPTALEDASLSTWIGPEDGTRYLYYPKGSVAGFLLDIMIRDASDNRRSLDNVMRELYQTTYKRGHGFTAAEWWGTMSRVAGSPGAAGMTFAAFSARYVDGREPFPYDRVLPLAGLRVVNDTVLEPRLNIQTAGDSTGVVVSQVGPGGAGGEAGLQPGDRILALGDVTVNSLDFGPAFRARFSHATDGDSLPIRIIRGADTLTLAGKVRLVARPEAKLEFDPAASAKALRIRNGIIRGKTGS
nr:PDZ domain-containing protein [Gemmatimonadales bacterium]